MIGNEPLNNQVINNFESGSSSVRLDLASSSSLNTRKIKYVISSTLHDDTLETD